MKILAVIEFAPGTGPKKRGSFSSAMADSGFTRLSGVSSCWVADHTFAIIGHAREAIARIATATEVRVHMAYLVEHGECATFPAATAGRA